MIGGVIVAMVLAVGIGVFALGNNDDSDMATESPRMSQESQNNSTNDTSTQQAQSSQNIVELAVATSDLSTLATAVTEAGLVDTLSAEGPFTVFAPTNEAFDALPDGTLDTLLMPENRSDLQGVLSYHVVTSKVMSSQLSDGQVIEAAQGGALTVRITDGKVMIEDATGAMAQVVTADIEASNGVVHVINKVLLPQ